MSEEKVGVLNEEARPVDERLERALDAASYRVTLTNQRKNALIKLQRDLTFSYNGGIFVSSPELISFVCAMKEVGEYMAMVVLDSNQTPVEVDPEKFLQELVSRNQSAMNFYATEFARIKKARTVRKVIE